MGLIGASEITSVAARWALITASNEINIASFSFSPTSPPQPHPGPSGSLV